MKVLFSCHRFPFEASPRGAELSMQSIIKYLQGEGFNVSGYKSDLPTGTYSGFPFNTDSLEEMIKASDIVLTWGKAATMTAAMCIKHTKPYILMVRWWRNVQPPPPGDLLNRHRDKAHIEKHRFIFENAKAIITNSDYSTLVIESYYNTPAITSYVPIEGEADNIANPDGALTIVSPNQNLGEWQLAVDISKHTNEKLLIVNYPKGEELFYKALENVELMPYVTDMKQVWRKTKILLKPIYHNDICGTTRVTIEAMQHGVPVIATDRSGLKEWAVNLVSPRYDISEWIEWVKVIDNDWLRINNQALDIFSRYDTHKNLAIFKKEILK